MRLLTRRIELLSGILYTQYLCQVSDITTALSITLIYKGNQVKAHSAESLTIILIKVIFAQVVKYDTFWISLESRVEMICINFKKIESIDAVILSVTNLPVMVS